MPPAQNRVSTRGRVLAVQRLAGNSAVLRLFDRPRRPDAESLLSGPASGLTASGRARAGFSLRGAVGASLGERRVREGGVGPRRRDGRSPRKPQETGPSARSPGKAPLGPEQGAEAGPGRPAPAEEASDLAERARSPGETSEGPGQGVGERVGGLAGGAGPAKGRAAAPDGPTKEREERAGAAEDAAEAPEGVAEAPERPAEPHEDPAFQDFAGRARRQAGAMKRHPPAAGEAQKARAAAQPPANDAASQAKAHQVEEMERAEPAPFDRQAFIAAVRAAIERRAPRNLEEADEYAESGAAEEVKGEVAGKVTDSAETAEKPVKEEAEASPDTSVAVEKPVTPLDPPSPTPTPGDPGASAAMPDPVPEQATDLDADRRETDRMMAEEEVTEEQLERSNEPAWGEAVAAKREGEEHSRTAPAAFREEEAGLLGQAREQAGAHANRDLAGMAATRREATAGVASSQEAAKGRDEEERARVAGEVEAIYDTTRTEVQAILDGLDVKVTETFDAGEATARARFERYLNRRMRAWKARRYGGAGGSLKWGKDKLLGLPDDVQRIFDAARGVYLKEMEKVIADVADVVGGELTRAKDRVAQGRQQISDYVAGLPDELQKVGQEAQGEIAGRFDELEGRVEAKQQELVETVAERYVAARDAVDDRLQKLREESKGLWGKVKDKIGGAVRTIVRLKDMILNVLQRAAGVVKRIIKDPIGFLGNLVKGVKSGLERFVARIGHHLKRALMGWLFGTLQAAGIELPENLNLKGILKLVLQVMGLTWANIRARLVRRLGEKAVTRLEKTVDVFKRLVVEGPMALWQDIVAKVSGLKERVLGEIREFLTVKVVKAGITWLLSLLNPAGAFIKACNMIVSIVRFFIERGRQIWEFVQTILNSLGKIASGAVGAVAQAIEKTLGRILPLALSFLASLLGLGGVAGKVKDIIKKAQRPVNKALDSVIGKLTKTGRKIWNKFRASKLAGKARKMHAKGKELVAKGKAKGEELKARARQKVRQAGDRIRGRRPSAPTPQRGPEGDVIGRVRAEVTRRLTGPFANLGEVRAVLRGLLGRFRRDGLRRLDAVPAADDPRRVEIVAAASPPTKIADATVEETETGWGVWEETASQVRSEYLSDAQRWRKPREGAELGPSRAVAVRLSDTAVRLNRRAVDQHVDASPASAVVKEEARSFAHARIDAAARAEEEMAVHRLLREAASRIQKLYGGRAGLALDVEHLTEVAQNPETFVRSRISRRYSAVTGRLRKGRPKRGSPEEQISEANVSPARKREIALLYAESVIEQELGDVGAGSTVEEPVEIELVIITRELHVSMTARRAEQRRGVS